MRLSLVAVLAAALLSFLASPAEAQLFRRAAPCPSCPSGVCQPQASAPLFLPAEPVWQAMPSRAAVPCLPPPTVEVIRGDVPPLSCPCTATNCTCPRTAAARSAPAASSCSGVPADGRWYPGKYVRRAVYGG